jgi:ParB/RepB/Spo0J family partition protein
MNRKKAAPTAKYPVEGVGAQTDPAPASGAPITYGDVSLDLIDPNPQQPRVVFAEDELKALAESIRENGVIQPIVIQALSSGRYILHDGERRLRASMLVGLERIPANIILSDAQDTRTLLVRAIVANDQRADLSPIERARGYQKLADEHGLSDADIARQTGKSRSVVANLRRLLQLPDDRQQQVATGELNERQALALLPLYQLPAEVQAKVLESYSGKKLAAPKGLTSDQIRSNLSDAIRGRGQEISLIDADQVFTGDGIHSPICTGCDLYVKVGGSLFCLDKACLTTKQNQVITSYLEQAKAVTGLNYLDPALELKYSQTDDFGISSGAQALQAGLETKCANLHLEYRRRPWDYGQGPSDFDRCRYTCFHNGEGCACAGALKAAQAAGRKANEQATQQLTDQATTHMAQIIKDNHPNFLRAVLDTMLRNYYGGGSDKTLKLKPDKVIRELAKQLIERNANPNTYRSLEVNQQAIDAWLDKMGLPAMAADPITGLSTQLARIEGWIAELPNPIQSEHLEAIRGNLTNLATLAEEMTKVEAPAELLARFDTAKSTLLDRREKAEQAFDLAAEIATVRSKLSDITAFLVRPQEHTDQKLLNRGLAAADLVYDINALIKTWSGIAPYQPGSATELSKLLAEANDLEAQCALRRRELNAEVPTLQAEEVPA